MPGRGRRGDGARRVVGGRGEPVLGLIFPPKDYPVPPEALRLYPTGVKFLSRGIGLERLTPDGYDAAIPKVIPAAESLVRDGATAISVMGTSLTFYKGRAFNEDLTARVKKATGVPVTTMSTGIVDGLRAAKREAHRRGHRLQRRGDGPPEGVPRGVRIPGAGREGARLRADPRRRRHHRQPAD